MKSYSSFQSLLILLFRIVLGGSMFYAHGMRKIDRVFGPRPVEFGDPLGIGPELSLYLVAFAEIVCALLIVLGLFTRLATIPLIITMGVVVFLVQWKNGFGDMEMPLIYMAGFLLLLGIGPGRYSLDQIRRKEW